MVLKRKCVIVLKGIVFYPLPLAQILTRGHRSRNAPGVLLTLQSTELVDVGSGFQSWSESSTPNQENKLH